MTDFLNFAELYKLKYKEENKMLKNIILPIVIIISIFACNCKSPNNSQPIPDSFLGQTPPGETPIRFASEIITDNFYPHSILIISPKLDRIYWTTFLDTVSSDKALYYSDFDGENLSVAVKETVFDAYGILSFIFLNDDNKILFGSLQPYDKMEGKLVRAVWTSVKTESGWGHPQPIESTVDTNWASLGSVSINSAGDIYFSGRMEDETAKIYCAKFEDGSYQKFEPLPEIINTGITIDPFIDFQDRYLLFAASNRADNIGIIDLYISYKDENGNWSQPTNLGQGISTQFIDRFPMVTEDGKYLFFVTSHSNHFPSTHTHFYWADAKILEK
jgi:hypothetical protein